MSRNVSFAPRRPSLSRLWVGLAAMSYPIFLILGNLATGFRRGGETTDFAASFVGALLFLIAAPTSWVFAFDFIDVTRFTVIAVGTATSLPLWFRAGTALAARAETWPVWIRRYLAMCVAWSVATIVAVGLIAQLA